MKSGRLPRCPRRVRPAGASQHRIENCTQSNADDCQISSSIDASYRLIYFTSIPTFHISEQEYFCLPLLFFWIYWWRKIRIMHSSKFQWHLGVLPKISYVALSCKIVRTKRVLPLHTRMNMCIYWYLTSWQSAQKSHKCASIAYTAHDTKKIHPSEHTNQQKKSSAAEKPISIICQFSHFLPVPMIVPVCLTRAISSSISAPARCLRSSVKTFSRTDFHPKKNVHKKIV